MARKGLPRKYAKMGFKKGWAAYKRANRTTTRTRRPSTKRKVVRVARRRNYRRRIGRARTAGGSFKPIIDGLLAGAAGGLATKYMGNMGHPVATLGIGYFRKNNVLKTEGARELGAMLVNQFAGGSNVGGGSGFFE